MKFKPIYAVLILIIGIAAIGLKINYDRRAQAAIELQRKQEAAAAEERQRQFAQQIQDDFQRKREEAKRNLELYGTTEPPPEVTQRQIEQHLKKIEENTANKKP